MSVLLDTKVCLCSTPLASHTRDFGKNIDLLTARWSECLASGAYIIGHVSDQVQQELSYTGLDEYIFSVKTYDEFERAMNDALCAAQYPDNYEAVLASNTTRVRMYKVIKLVKEKCE